jgi:4-diphosphocytidyl-2C-methyl-D-erythritol kinase
MLAEELSLAWSRAECADAGDDLRRMCSLMSNDFEPLIDERYGLIIQMKQLMMQAGAMGALMSGSGPTVFGVYGSPPQATEAAEVLRSLAADCGFDVDRYGFSVIDACIGDSRS